MIKYHTYGASGIAFVSRIGVDIDVSKACNCMSLLL